VPPKTPGGFPFNWIRERKRGPTPFLFARKNPTPPGFNILNCHYPVPRVSVSLSCTPSVSVIILYPECERHYPVSRVSVSLSCTPSVSAIIQYPECQCHYFVPQCQFPLSCTPSVSVIILYPKCQCLYPVLSFIGFYPVEVDASEIGAGACFVSQREVLIAQNGEVLRYSSVPILCAARELSVKMSEMQMKTPKGGRSVAKKVKRLTCPLCISQAGMPYTPHFLWSRNHPPPCIRWGINSLRRPPGPAANVESDSDTLRGYSPSGGGRHKSQAMETLDRQGAPLSRFTTP
ncbi:unnamed protein product, partial [Ranitomeya imitator]